VLDIFTSSIFDVEELRREKEVVNQEILMIEDSPEDYLHDFLLIKFWPQNTLGLPVQGVSETVLSFDREQVVGYFEDVFAKLGLMVVAVGNLDHGELVDIFSSRLGGERFRTKKRELEPPSPSRGVYVEARDIEQVHVCVAFPGPSKKDRLLHAGKVLRTITGGGMSSRLFQEVREKRGLAYAVHTGLSTFSDSGLFRVYAGTTPEHLSELLELTLSILKEVKEGGVTEEELERGKEQLKGNLLLNYESTDYRLIQLATNEMYYGEYVTPDEISRRIDQVTLDNVVEFCEKYLKEEYMVITAVGNVKEGELSVEASL